MTPLSRSLSSVVFSLALISTHVSGVLAQGTANSFALLTKNQRLSGFRTESVYVDDSGRPMGARFVHERSGFTLDLLGMQTVPQTFFWVNSMPVGDRGEPHTQEHLLVGKGNKGRKFLTLTDYSMTQMNASLNQEYTDYHFNTSGGSEAFY